MGFFDKLTAKPIPPPPPAPEPVVIPEPEPAPAPEPPAPEPEPIPEPAPVIRQVQAAPGGVRVNYRIAGVWMPDGSVTKVSGAYIEIQDHDEVYDQDSLIPLNRLEAQVLGKRYALSLVP